MKGDGRVAGEGRVVGIPKFHSCGNCTMPLMISLMPGLFFAGRGVASFPGAWE